MTKHKKGAPTLTKRERILMGIGAGAALLLIPFLPVWSFYTQLDEVYRDAQSVPASMRAIAPPEGECPPDLEALKLSAHLATGKCVSSLPNGSRDPFLGRRLLKDLSLPLLGRGVELWREVGRACDVPGFIGLTQSGNAAEQAKIFVALLPDLELAIAAYEKARTLLQIVVYTWLFFEIVGWVIILGLAHRIWWPRYRARWE